MSWTGAGDPSRLRQLLDAVVAIGSDLDLGGALRRITEAATSLVDAKYGALGVLGRSGAALVEFISVGIDDETRKELGPLPKGHGILGLLITDPRPIRLPDLTKHPDSFGFPPGHPPMRSFLGVPIVVRGAIFGNLYLTDKQSADAFTDVDQELTVALAAAAGAAIENARLNTRVRELAVLEDRDRIAMDLHDTVIQQLFAIGLSLQGTARSIQDPAAAARIQTAVDDLDGTIKQIRSTIFALGTSFRSGGGLREHVLAVAAEASGVLRSRPHVLFDGPVDAALTTDQAEALVAALREALTNVARHAQATNVWLEVIASDRDVILRVEDDGVGPPPAGPSSGRGLANLAARARRFGGTFALASGPRGGTLAEWRIPRAASRLGSDYPARRPLT